jgi:uracil-DNA glycosylase
MKQTSLLSMLVRKPAVASSAEPAQTRSTPSPELSAAATTKAEAEAEQDACRHKAIREMFEPRLGAGWYAALEAELRRPTIETCLKEAAMAREKYGNTVFPPEEHVFRAFLETPLEKVRVVIVGQDPYHGRGQAMGLSFSVPRGVRVPPSLMNMLKEAGTWPSPHGDLTSWSQQGVLLLNSVLTVLEGKPLSHKSLGWERITDAAIRGLSRERKDVIFLLWGREAQAKAKLVDSSRHKVLSAGHPSPLSYERHFKGCNHFAKTNEILAARGETPINWALPP